MSRSERVRRAIAFRQPDRVPVVFWNCDQTAGDVLLYHLALGAPGEGSVNAWDWSLNEWGYRLVKNGDGTMGHPTEPVYRELPSAARRVPMLREAERMSAVPAFQAQCGDRYRLASLDLSGFTVYTFLRGFENAMQDFLLEPEGFAMLMDRIVEFECDLIRMAARHGSSRSGSGTGGPGRLRGVARAENSSPAPIFESVLREIRLALALCPCVCPLYTCIYPLYLSLN